MKFGIAVLAIVVVAIGHAFAQDPPAEVVKISTNLIQLDATVIDSKGNAIRDLSRDDFEIFENGRKQPISGFSFVSHSAKKTVTSATSPPSSGPVVAPVPPTEVRPNQVRRAVALVVDDLSLSYESMNKTRRSLKKFVEEQMSEGDLVAIIRVGVGMGALQQFTSDKRQLLANIERLKYNPLGRGRIGSFEPVNDGPEHLQKQDEDGDDALVKKQFKDAVSDYQESIWAQGTLGALRYVVNGLASLPGRKAVVLFSDGIQIIQRDEHGFTQVSRGKEFIKTLIDMANRASVVFYTMDARGLEDGAVTARDSVYTGRVPSNRRLQEVRDERSKELFDTQDGLVHLAEETGGFPVLIQNDLNAGLEKVLDDQSYYLIAYEPSAETFDAKTSRSNNIEIKVKRDGAKVRYRSDFFATTAEPTTKPAKQTQANRLQEALTSPFVANKIGLRMNALYGNNNGADSITAFLHIDTRDLKFTDAGNGLKKASVDVLAVTYGDNGVAVDKIAQRYEMPVKQDDYERMLKQGYVFYFNFPIKKPGPYQFRVAIHDPLGDTIGSASQFVEVPDLKKKALTLSGITLENFSSDVWQQMLSGMQKVSGKKEGGVVTSGDPMSDTSLRRFSRGTVLHYSFDVYNAQAQQNVTSRLRVFRDGELVLDGKALPVDASTRTSNGIRSSGAMSLPTNMAPGDYILQIIVADGSNKRQATQYVQFELL